MADVNESAIHGHKHRIKTPLVLFISILLLILLAGGGLFYVQNKSFLQQKITETTEPTFQVDHLLLKVLLKEKEFSRQEVRILNTDSKEQGFSTSITGMQGIVSLDENAFSLLPRQTKIITAQFNALDPTRGIEHQPGVYAGMFVVESRSKQEIPLIVEIESSQVMFDTNLNPVALENKVERGKEFIIEVRLFNLQTIDAENVDMRYAVKDMRGNTLLTEQETVVVKTQASFFKTITIPSSIDPGTYVFIAESRVGDSIGTSSYLFEVVDPNIETAASLRTFCTNDPLCKGLSIAVIALLLAVAAYFYLFVGAFFYQKMSSVISPQSVLNQREQKKSRLAEFMEQWRKNSKEKQQRIVKEEERRIREQERLAKIEAAREEREQQQKRLEEERKEAELERKKTEAEKQRKVQEELRQKQEEEQRKVRKDQLREKTRLARIRETERIKFQEQRRKEAQERIKRIKIFWREQGKFFSRMADQWRKTAKLREESNEAKRKEEERLAAIEEERRQKEDAQRRIEEQKLQAEAEGIRRIEERKMRIEAAKRQKAEEKRRIEEEEYRREQERLAAIESRRREREHHKRHLEEEKLKRQQDAEREKARLEKEKLRIAKRKQRIEFLKLVFLGKKQEGVIKAIKTSRSILVINRLLEKGQSEIEQGKIKQARSTYETTLKRYSTLSIEEKKGVYGPITSFYNKLLEAENRHHQHEKLQKEQPLLVKWGLLKSKEQREAERKAREAEAQKQRKIDEANRRKQEAQEVKQKKLQEIEFKKQQEEAQRQEKHRLQEQKKLEAEERKQQLILQKQQHKEELEKQQQELAQKKQEEQQRKVIEEEEKRREEEREAQEKEREKAIKEQEFAKKKRDERIKETEKAITSLEHQSLDIVQQKQKLVQSLSNIVQSADGAIGKKYDEHSKQYAHLEQRIRSLEHRQVEVENKLLKARKEILGLEGGAANNLKAIFLPITFKLKAQPLPSFPPKQSSQIAERNDQEEGQTTRVKKDNEKLSGQSIEKISFAKHFSKEELAKKSPAFRKYRHALIEAETALNKGDIQQAKSSYLKARELYLALEYAEKTEAYGELNGAYTHLSK